MPTAEKVNITGTNEDDRVKIEALSTQLPKWKECDYIKKRRQEKQYWDHIKYVATGIVLKGYKPSAWKDNDDYDDDDKKMPPLVNRNTIKNPYLNQARAKVETRGDKDEAYVKTHGRRVSSTAYIPNDNPNAIYVIGFHPVGINSESVSLPSQTTWSRNSTPQSTIESIVPRESKKSAENNQPAVIEHAVDSTEPYSTQDMQTPPRTLRTTQPTSSDSSTLFPSPDSANAPVFSYKQPPTPYPFNFVQKINDAILRGTATTPVKQVIQFEGNSKTVLAYYDFTPMTKEEAESTFDIQISDNPIKKKRPAEGQSEYEPLRKKLLVTKTVWNSAGPAYHVHDQETHDNTCPDYCPYHSDNPDIVH